MKGKKQSGIKIVIIGVVLLCLVLGYYYYLSNRNKENTEETPKEMTAVQEVLLYDFDKSYPPTPKEVVKRFCEITQCFYNEEYTEEEFIALALLIQELYDEELIANQTKEQYIANLRWDVNQFKEQEIVVSSYATSSSTDVDFFSQDGYEWARLYCTFTLRQGTGLKVTNEVFILRKDEEGHWKIFGWKMEEE